MYAIETMALTRDYESSVGIIKRTRKTTHAVRGIDLRVERGQIFGLLGPNGAGKTTTIKILATLLAPSSGEARVLGYRCFGDEDKLRGRINAVFGGERNLYWRLSALDNLKFFSDLYAVPYREQKKRLPELLETVGLLGRERERVESYSKGMKQRLQIARALVNDPEVLFLDEPTIGLDPEGARDLRGIVRGLKARGKTILLTTHYMYEADELSDGIAVIDGGRIVASGAPAELKKLCEGASVAEIRVRGDGERELALLSRLPGVESADLARLGEHALISLGTRDPGALAALAARTVGGGELVSVASREATLEDAYLSLVARGRE
jgi:ABC-2 type transport system ATP-binding protein